MGVGLKALTENTTTILESEYNDLVRQSEQLRILKRFILLDPADKVSIITLLTAMDQPIETQ